MKLIWVVLVLQASASGPVHIGTGSWSHSTEDACLAEADIVRLRMAQIRMVVTVECVAMEAPIP
jgi:hypothetical protein